jgi:sterol desaturase/sphingolipid hydroxylase (fatty acid hydroxylase superfamily)
MCAVNSPDLAEKQRQFNAAMEKYTSRKGYQAFGLLVSLANISLQVWLLWLVWLYPIGIGGELTAIICAWLLADFLSGVVHLYMDDNDRYESLDGPLIANFHLHHKTPLYKVKSLPVVYFMESGSKVWLVPFLLLTALLFRVDGISPLLLHLLVYVGVFSSVSEVSHYLCHTSTSPLAMFLGNSGILLSKSHHALHHLRDNANYAFLNGVSDPLINMFAVKWSRGYKQHTDLHYATYQIDGDSR